MRESERDERERAGRGEIQHGTPGDMEGKSTKKNQDSHCW